MHALYIYFVNFNIVTFSCMCSLFPVKILIVIILLRSICICYSTCWILINMFKKCWSFSHVSIVWLSITILTCFSKFKTVFLYLCPNWLSTTQYYSNELCNLGNLSSNNKILSKKPILSKRHYEYLIMELTLCSLLSLSHVLSSSSSSLSSSSS